MRLCGPAVSLAVACSSPAVPQQTPDAGPFAPAAHTLPPPIPLNGGGVLSDPSIVVVTFAGDPMADSVEAYGDWIVGSQWLGAVGGEYGVGSARMLAKVRLTTSAPTFASTAAFSAYVASMVGVALPAPPSASTLYVVVLPGGASFTDSAIGVLCNDFTGYHDAGPQREYTFAVIGDCPKHVAGLTDTQQVQRVFSHEVIEALTDPFGDGYAARDPANPWRWVGGGEVADVCNGYAHEQGFLAVRSWSNDAAAAGEDPCQPNDQPTTYFNLSSPILGTELAVGSSTSLTVGGWSTAPVSDWVVMVSGTGEFAPSAALSPTTMNNGVSAQLTITVPPGVTPGTHGAVLLKSLHPADASYQLLPIEVTAR